MTSYSLHGPVAPEATVRFTSSLNEAIPTLARVVSLPIFLTTVLVLTTVNEVTALQLAESLVLLLFAWGGYCKWRRQKDCQIPLLAMVTFMFWLYYGLALFWGDRNKVGLYGRGAEFSDSALTWSMLLVVVGATMTWLGASLGIGKTLIPKSVPDIPTDLRKWNYLRLLLMAGIVMGFSEGLPFMFGEGWRQVIYIVQTGIPLTAFTILLGAHFRGESSTLDKVLILTFFLTRSLIGVSSGWLGAFAWLIAICAAVYIRERKRIPRFTIVVIALSVLFFQPGKQAVRERYWYDQTEASKTERIVFWLEESSSRWMNALNDPQGASVKELSSQSLVRLSLLTQTASVIELTPETVPFQYFRLYSYIPISLIPRFVWSDKPIMNEANQFYQVAYGLTPEDQIGNVQITIGFLTESYIGFGWPGIVVIMFAFGVLLDVLQRLLFTKNGGILLNGVGFALLPRLLGIESQAAVYLTGLIQHVLFVLLVLLPLIHFKKTAVND